MVVGFSTKDAQRIGAAVRAFEREHRGARHLIRRRAPQLAQPFFLGKLDEDLKHDDSADMSVWSGVALSEADNTSTVTVYPWKFADATKIASGAFVIAALINGIYYVIYSDTCPVDE